MHLFIIVLWNNFRLRVWEFPYPTSSSVNTLQPQCNNQNQASHTDTLSLIKLQLALFLVQDATWHLVVRCPQSLFNLWQFSVFISFMPLTFLTTIDQLFCRLFLSLSLSGVFPLWLDWGYPFLAKIYRSDGVSFPVPHLKGYTMSICLISGDVNHSYLVKVVLSGYFHPWILAFINKSCLWQLLLHFFNGDFLLPLISLHLLIRILP